MSSVRTLSIYAILLSVGLRVAAQDTTSPTFDVAAIKSNPSDRACLLKANFPNRLTARGCSANRLMQIAFELTKYQIVGMPAWDESASFNINAIFAPESGPTRQDRFKMLQRLLVDRFKLATHREQRQVTTYELTLSRDR